MTHKFLKSHHNVLVHLGFHSDISDGFLLEFSGLCAVWAPVFMDPNFQAIPTQSTVFVYIFLLYLVLQLKPKFSKLLRSKPFPSPSVKLCRICITQLVLRHSLRSILGPLNLPIEFFQFVDTKVHYSVLLSSKDCKTWWHNGTTNTI